MKTRTLTYAGRRVALPDLADFGKFYGKLESGRWEPATFETLGRHAVPGVTYVDIGAWIGVTPFWAAQTAERVVAVEPDPRCREILRALAPAHPNLVLIEGALSDAAEVEIHAVDGFGSSETSVLDIGDPGGETVRVPGLSLARILEAAGPAPKFVKIDIEGYEFSALNDLGPLKSAELRGLQVALHPQLLEASLKGPRVWRRLRVAAATFRLIGRLGSLFPNSRLTKYHGRIDYLLRGILFRRIPRGADLVVD